MLFWCETFILKDVHESSWHCQIIWLRGSLSKERVAEKKALTQFSISEVRWNVDRFNVSAIIPRYFRNTLWNKKSLTSEKNELSCQMLYCAGGARSSIARMSFTIQTNQPDL